MSLTIHIVDQVYPTVVEEIRAAAPSAVVRQFDTQAEFEAAIHEADIIAATSLSAAAFSRAQRLRWIQSWAAGPNQMLIPEILSSDMPVASAKGNGAIPLAEHVLMMMLMLDRDVLRSLRAQTERRWDRFFHGELNGRVCGIIGAGYLGEELAYKAKAFHMQVLGMRRTSAPARHFDRMYARDQLHELLAASDFVVMTAPETPDTIGMLSHAEFACMKPEAFFVCVSRGRTVDADALYQALANKTIAGAGLDAHAIEPLPSDSPFYDLDNVILTPHHGAVTMGSRRRAVEIFTENIRRHLTDRPLINLVDRATGY